MSALAADKMFAKALDAYVAFYESLEPSSVSEIRSVVAPDVYFQDPFNSVRGVDAYEKILREMFEQCDDPTFAVVERVASGTKAYLKWRFSFSFKGKDKKIEVVGVSELEFDLQARIVSHVDYWDPASGLYEHIPILGSILRTIRKRIQTKV